MEREESAKKLNRVSESFTLQFEGSNYRIGIDWSKSNYPISANLEILYTKLKQDELLVCFVVN